MSAAVELYIAGRRIADWQRVDITRGIESAVGYFGLGLSGEGGPLPPWEPCRLDLAGQPVIDGWLDTVDYADTATSTEVSVAGRDRAADLVDCAAVASPGEWHGARLETIAADLARPFGLSVEVVNDTGAPFDRFRLQESESGWDAIERACRQRAILCYSDGARTLRLARAGGERAATALLQGGEGANVLAIRTTYSTADRYSSYTFRGQRPGRDGEEPAEAAHVTATAEDPQVPRFRPYSALAEDLADGVSLRERAAWEASVRRGRSRLVTLSVQGWQDGAANLWRLNTLVRVRHASRGLDAELLIASLRYVLDEEGTRTEMTLADPAAYQRLPEPDRESDW